MREERRWRNKEHRGKKNMEKMIERIEDRGKEEEWGEEKDGERWEDGGGREKDERKDEGGDGGGGEEEEEGYGEREKEDGGGAGGGKGKKRT